MKPTQEKEKEKKSNEQPTQEKEKKKKKTTNSQPRKKERRKKKKKRTANLGKRKKKVKSGQKLRLVLFAGPSCVFNYKNAIELWKQSYGNRVIVCQTTFLLWVPPFLSYELWKQRIELSKKAIQTAP